VEASDIVRRYYNHHAEYEDKRLFQDKYHMLEFIVSFYYLRKYLPKRGNILDCGCGSGNYSIVLAGMGYNVALVDISSKLLEIAKNKFLRCGRQDKIIAIVNTSSTNLGVFKDNFFDATICFGPLYHLPRPDDQEKTVKELWRTLKVGGILFISAISYYGVIGTVVKSYPEEFKMKNHEPMFLYGIHLSKWHGDDISVFPDAKFWKPLELKKFMEKRGFETIEMAACEGIFTHLREYVNEISKDKAIWNKIVRIAIESSNDPTLLGNTEHFLWIGKKIG